MIAIGIEQKVTNLETKLAEALDRITRLEHCQPSVVSGPCSPEERQVLPLDSPEMTYALRLAAECFPGSQTEVEVEFDPAEPNWKWYSLNISWPGGIRETLDRSQDWHSRMNAAFPHVGEQFRICLY